MLFIHPMWYSESQRIGMQRCHPLAYNIHGVGELIGFLGMLVLLSNGVWMAWLSITGRFTVDTWWQLAWPFGMGVVSELMVQLSWLMVARRGYQYDDDKREASWDKDGQRVTYRYGQEKASPDAPGNSEH